MKCPIPSCEGTLEILEQTAHRQYSGHRETKYGESTTTNRRCNKCGLILEFINFEEEVKGPKGDWRNITTSP
jgi:hypothetical protein